MFVCVCYDNIDIFIFRFTQTSLTSTIYITTYKIVFTYSEAKSSPRTTGLSITTAVAAQTTTMLIIDSQLVPIGPQEKVSKALIVMQLFIHNSRAQTSLQLCYPSHSSSYTPFTSLLFSLSPSLLFEWSTHTLKENKCN